MTTKIYAIRNKSSGEFVSYNSKCAWSKAGSAKNAFNLHGSWQRNGKRVRFDEQNALEIIELTEYVWKYEELGK